MELASDAFELTGIHPYNKTVFTDVDFLPSKVTDQELDPAFSDDDQILFEFPDERNQTII